MLMQKIKDFLLKITIIYGSKVSKFRPIKNWNSEYAHNQKPNKINKKHKNH